MPELKREQAEAVFHNDGNILVSASAGSGKTFVMIERLIRLIAEGRASVKEILAVTFTEMAASEMKEKLKAALTLKIAQTGDSRLIKELAEVSTADISTMHAFCGRLVRAYFYRAGVSPDFKILDESESGALKHESVNKAFRELYESGEQWFKDVLLRHLDKRSDQTLKATVIKMSERGRVNADGDIYAKQAERIYSKEGFNELLLQFKTELDVRLDRFIDSLAQALKIFTIENKEKIAEFIKSLLLDVRALREAQDLYAVKQFDGYKKELPKGVRLIGELKDVYDSTVCVREEFKEICLSLNVGLTDKESDIQSLDGERAHLLGLFKIVKKYEQIYTQAKRDENALDFADLEHFALEVLSDSEIREEVKSKYKYIFVDEYQDTNGVQEEIISALERDNLFMVGDAKQSIYGFRGCRPEIFLNKLENMSKNGQKTVLLNHNFRSSHKVIELVNKVFSYSMTKEYFGMSYKDTSCLKSGGVYGEEQSGRVELHLMKNPPRQAKEFETPRIYDILEEIKKPVDQSAQLTPALLANVIEQELQKDFYDAKEKRYRPVKYGDITILTRNKDNAYVKSIVKGLVGYGIPVVSVVKENVCDYPEIRFLISALKLLDCFNQDIPLASVLKSPIGNFTDEELAEIVLRFNDDKREGNFYNAVLHYIEVAETPLKIRLEEFCEYFNKLRLLSDFVGAHGALKRIIQDKNLEQYLSAQQSGRLNEKRLNKFLSACLIDGKSLSVKEFLDRIENYPTAFGLSDGAEENSVKVMTIHASKGLEFPVVIVCGLERPANAKEEREDIMFDQDLGFAVKSYNDMARTARETPIRTIFRQRMRDNRLKEELRLFYVALTRASYSLHLTFSGSKDGRKKHFTGAKKFLDYLPIDIELNEHCATDLPLSDRVVGVKRVLIGEPDLDKVEQMKRDFGYCYPHIADTVLSLKNTVTKATHELTEDTPPVHVLFEDDAPDVEKGIIAHKIMEYFDFYGKGLTEQVNDLVAKGALTSEQVEKVNLDRLNAAVCAKELLELKDRTLYREKDFIVSLNASEVFDTESTELVLLQGVIDLLAVGKDDAVIVDYKYSSLQAESLKARYSKQLDLYAYALKRATGIKVKKKILINLFTGESVPFD